jgi:hypothetical protein
VRLALRFLCAITAYFHLSRGTKFPTLRIAFHLLTILLATTPVVAFSDSATAQDAFALVAAIILALAAMAPLSDVTNTMRLLRGISLAILFPVLFMTFQILPIPFASLVNPIWPSAATALNEPSMWGHVSIDPGMTLRDLMLYLAVLSLIIATIILTRDRQRAQTTLFILCAMTVFMSVEALLGELSSFAGIFPIRGAAAATFVAAGAMGTLLNGAAIVMTVERHFTTQREPETSQRPLLWKLPLGLAGVAICLAATTSLGRGNVAMAAGVGLAIIFVIVLLRRLAFYPGMMADWVVLLVAVGFGVVALRFQNNLLDSIGFAAPSDREALALSRRMLSDSNWVGSGVGTFGSLAKVYLDFGAASITNPPSTVIGMAVEWGRPVLALLFVFAIQLFALTFLGALRRGRDSFFAAAAAASVAVVIFEVFCDTSLMNLAIQTIIAVVVGLGISQSIGRTSGLES